MNEKKEIEKWQKTAVLANKDTKYLQFIDGMNNELTTFIQYDECNAMKETAYLLSSKNNRDRLNEAVEQIETLKFSKQDFDI